MNPLNFVLLALSVFTGVLSLVWFLRLIGASIRGGGVTTGLVLLTPVGIIVTGALIYFGLTLR